MNEERTIRGVRYVRDAFGWIWRENPKAKKGEPHWLRTGFSLVGLAAAINQIG